MGAESNGIIFDRSLEISPFDRDGLKAVLSRQRSRQRRGKAAMSLTNKAEAESSRPRRGRLNSRQGRGEAELKSTLFVSF